MKQFLFFIIAILFLQFAKAESPTPFPADSIFQLKQKWTSQDGKTLQLSDLSGHPTVITMTFASCPGACPLMVNDMKSFDQSLNKKMKKQLRFATFSIDPVRDTPEALKKFYAKMHLDKRWTLFSSDNEQVRELAAVLGFNYKDLGDGDFTHSTTVYLLSANGRILAKKERQGEWAEFTAKLKEELKPSAPR